MIEKMNMHYSFTNPASIHEEEALTALELAGRQGAKINEIIEDQNNLRKHVGDELNRFEKENIPSEVAKDVQKYINDGAFDAQIDKSIGNLEKRVDTLLSTVPAGGTTMDAEVIDIRTDEYGNTHANAGAAVRAQGVAAHNVRNALIYIGNSGTVKWSPLTATSAEANGGVRVVFSNTMGIAVKGRFDASADMSWENITSEISEYVTINGNECIIDLWGYRPNLCFDTLSGKLKICYANNVTKDDIVLIRCTVQTVVGGELLPNQNQIDVKSALKTAEDVTKAFNTKEGTFFYTSNSAPVYFSAHGSNGGLLVRIAGTLVKVENGVGVDVNWDSLAAKLVANGTITKDDSGVSITLDYGYGLVYRDGSFSTHYRSSIKPSDIVLVLNAWSNPIFGELLSIANSTTIKEMQNQLTQAEVFPAISDSKLQEYTGIVTGGGSTQAFMYFADPHWASFWDDGWQENMKNYLNQMENVYTRLNLDFCLSCGDWLVQNDNKATAKHKLNAIAGTMRKRFGKFFNAVGNHDYNYQYISDGVNGLNVDMLTPEEIRNCWYREHEHTYHTFVNGDTLYVVFDTGIDWAGHASLEAYVSSQLPWFAAILRDNKYAHVVIVAHIMYTDETCSATTQTANVITDIANHFNQRLSTTVNGESFDFSTATGRVEFALTGHTHRDHIGTLNDIPVICTTNTTNGNIPTFDLVFADFDSRSVNLIRVGTGQNRTVAL